MRRLASRGLFNKLLPVALSLGTRGGGLALQFFATLVIARLLGAAEMGVYAVYLAWVMVLAGLISVGTPSFSMREVAINYHRSLFANARRIVGRLALLNLAAGSILALFVLLAMLVGQQQISEWVGFDYPLLTVLGALLFILLRLVCESLKAADGVNLAVFIESVLLAGIMLAFALTGLGFFDLSLDAISVILWNLGATCLVLVVAAWALKNRLHSAETASAIPLGLSPLLPFWGNFLLVMAFINAPLILAPMVAEDSEIGQFSIAYRLIMILVNVLGVLASIFGPKFARAYADNDVRLLNSLMRKSALFSLLVFMPIGLVLSLFPGPILSIFGAEFVAADRYLWVMLAGQFIYASTGLVGLFLAMSGNAQLEFRLSLLGVLLMYSSIWVLGSAYGMLGVAIAFAVSLALKNLLSLVFVISTLRKLANN